MDNCDLAMELMEAWDARDGIRVGDILLMDDGTYRRFTHDWNSIEQPFGGGVQLTIDSENDGSFFLSQNGHASYSGGLAASVDKNKLVDTGEMMDAEFWFFSGHIMKAHNAVYFSIPVRIYKLKKETT